MQADYVGEIVKRLNELPYRCILFDGEWGIGKTYAIDESLDEQENVCKISMFGMQNSQQIYHEALFQLALRNNKAGKIGEIAANILKGAAEIWDKAAQAKDVLQSIARERELFLLLSKEFDSTHIIVIDDLERISKKVSLEEVLGIVEELKKCNYVKVILVANTKELKDDKEIFEKYKEKVIDRVYQITERPEKINWGDLGIHGGFMTDFLAVHKVKNLRTLQKAQKFYDDVKVHCPKNISEQFLDEIKLICFAIVVESTDNLYYKEIDENEKDKTKLSLMKLHNELEYRIDNYLSAIRSSKSLRTLLLRYYVNEIMLVSGDFQAEYVAFLQAGYKANYYKSDEEIKQMLPKLAEQINSVDNLVELNKFIDEYVVWSEIVGQDYNTVLNVYKNKLHDMLLDQSLKGQENVLNYGYEMWRTESQAVRDIYIGTRNQVRKEWIGQLITYLSEGRKDSKAFEYSYKLRNLYDISYYRDIINEFIQSLYRKEFFPIGSIDYVGYDICYNIMYILYCFDSDKLLSYCTNLEKECDKMSAYRMKYIMERFIKGY